VRRLAWRAAWLLLAAAVPLIQQRIDGGLGAYRAQEEALYLWSGASVRRLWPGFEDVASDVYWLRTVQYYGAKRAFATQKRYDLLEALIDITTSLDPRFEIAYRYGAYFLAEPPPAGAGDPQKAVALLERGAEATQSWRLRQEAAYLTFLYLCDARRASDMLMEASRMPGAAFWLEALAADILARAHESALARSLWVRIRDDAVTPQARVNAEVNLRILDARDAVDALNDAAQRVQRRTGRAPATLEELQSLDRRLPVRDPEGIRFEYDSTEGRVSLSTRSPLWRSVGENSYCRNSH
jgi:hypothetical protein